MLYLAILPILTIIILLLVFRLPLVRAAPIALAVTIVLAVSSWRIPIDSLTSVFAKATLLTIDILLIIFGAIFFVSYLRSTGRLQGMLEQLKKMTPEPGAQVILFAWLFGSFIEGISGFGTSGAIIAPFLVGVGFSPLTAILVSLVANCTAVTFGAVGTPIRVGFADFSHLDFSWNTALVNLVPGFFIPFVLIYFASSLKVNSQTLLRFFSQGLVGALAFLVPYLIFARFSYDYPSIMGGGIGFFLFVVFLFLNGNQRVKVAEVIKCFAPYGVLLFFLMLGKLVFSHFNFTIELGNGLTHTIHIFNPGFAFLTSILLLSVKRKTTLSQLIDLSRVTMSQLKKTTFSIFLISAMTYTMILTDRSLDIPGMLETISSSLLGPNLPYYSAFIGAFGSFLSGSATVSNLLFADIQFQGAVMVGLSTKLLLALQLTGAAAGNMISLSNILAVEAAVGVEAKEGFLLARLFIPCLLYLALATVTANFVL